MDERNLHLELIDFAEDAAGALLNPRGRIVDTTDLQDSMRIAGQRDAIEVYANGDRYIVCDGHRRITAARALGWDTIRAVVKGDLSGRDEVSLLVDMLATNVRENFKPTALGRAICKVSLDNRWGLERAAKLCGLEVDRAQLLVDLLAAPDAVQRRVDSGEMSLSAWKVLRDKPRETQERAADLPKPTVAAVRQVAREEKSAGVLTDMLEQMQTEHQLVTALNEAKVRIMAQWFTLGVAEKMRLAAVIEQLYSFTHQTTDEALPEAV